MGILDNLANPTASTPNTPPAPPNAPDAPAPQGASMQQIYQLVMKNAMEAISGTAEKVIQEKGPIDGITELVAMAMVANLESAQQSEIDIPPQVMIKAAADITMSLLQQFDAPEERKDDLFIQIMMTAMEQFGEMSHGMLSPEEEQQYVQMVEQITEAEQQRHHQPEGNMTQPTEEEM